MERTLIVWWDMAEVGKLVQDRHGDLSFAYSPVWLSSPAPRPISRSLPLQEASFGRRQCRPFFGGLLPEANRRIGVAGALGVSPANEFALLDRLGGDVAGALSLLHEGERPTPPCPGFRTRTAGRHRLCRHPRSATPSADARRR